MIKLVDRYVGRAAVLGILGVWLGLTVLFIVFNLLDELREARADYGVVDALWFVVLTIPRMAYQVFPVSALLGALVGVGGLAAANELVAFRTSGISRLRLSLAALAGTMLVTVPVMIMGEWVAPAAEQQARAFRLSEIVGTAIIGGARGMWMRDGNDMVNIQRPILSADRGEQSITFQNVVVYRFGDAGLSEITRAGTATHDGTFWTLKDVNHVAFTPEGIVPSHRDSEAWSTEVRPQLLDSAVSRPRLLSMLFPFTVIALVMAGMPFVFAQARSQTLGLRLFIGMSVGGLFMIVNRTFLKMTSVYDLPPALMMSIPILLLAMAAVLALRRSV